MSYARCFELGILGMNQRAGHHNLSLAVDLDGTLIATDLIWESIIALLKRNPLYLLLIPFWALRGAYELKSQLARLVEIDPESLPYRADFLAFLREEHAKGRDIYLATGSHKKFADGIAKHLGIFKGVFASENGVSLTSTRKRAALESALGRGNYDYAGNSRDDITVFDGAHGAIVVAPDRHAGSYQRRMGSVLFAAKRPSAKSLLKLLRVHQWAKNVLVAVPAVLANDILRTTTLVECLAAFASFSLAASAIYIINDLIDLPLDRRHKTKRNRPLAAGVISIPVALVVAGASLLAATSIAMNLPWMFGAVLASYVAMTTAYTFAIKRMLLVDVLTLASLYTVRVVAGAAATMIDLSFWLLAFSIFFFLSLALVKRFVELDDNPASTSKIAGRGYRHADKQAIGEAGMASAFAAALVLALYIDSPEVQQLYGQPWLIWPLCPMVLYLSIRIWVLARRGEMHDDPVVFLLTDWRSVVMVALGAVMIVAASL